MLPYDLVMHNLFHNYFARWEELKLSQFKIIFLHNTYFYFREILYYIINLLNDNFALRLDHFMYFFVLNWKLGTNPPKKYGTHPTPPH